MDFSNKEIKVFQRYSVMVKSTIMSLIFYFIGVSQFSLSAQFLGATISAGWNQGQIEVLLFHYSTEDISSNKNTSVDIYNTESNITFTSLQLELENSSKLKNDISNPCRDHQQSNVYLNVYRGKAPPDVVGYNYGIKWISPTIDVSLTSADRIIGQSLVIFCSLEGKENSELCVIEPKFHPYFNLCKDQPALQSFEVKANVPDEYEIRYQPLQYTPLKESDLLPITDGRIKENGPIDLKWKKGYSQNTPLGTDAITITSPTNSMEFTAKTEGQFIVCHGIKQKKSGLINTVSAYLVEVR